MNDLLLLAQALADPTRVRVVAALRQSELCVCELADALEISQSRLSMSLQAIRKVGLVDTRKDGKWIYYAIAVGQAALLGTLFCHYDESLKADRRLQRDSERLRQRLRDRRDGRCVRGFTDSGGQ